MSEQICRLSHYSWRAIRVFIDSYQCILKAQMIALNISIMDPILHTHVVKYETVHRESSRGSGR